VAGVIEAVETTVEANVGELLVAAKRAEESGGLYGLGTGYTECAVDRRCGEVKGGFVGG
jgi:hypothetical protein